MNLLESWTYILLSLLYVTAGWSPSTPPLSRLTGKLDNFRENSRYLLPFPPLPPFQPVLSPLLENFRWKICLSDTKPEEHAIYGWRKKTSAWLSSTIQNRVPDFILIYLVVFRTIQNRVPVFIILCRVSFHNSEQSSCFYNYMQGCLPQFRTEFLFLYLYAWLSSVQFRTEFLFL